MSQHSCDTMHGDTLVTIVMGFDRRLQYFHLKVEKRAPSNTAQSSTDTEEDNSIIYFNLYDEALERGLCHDLDYYRQKLNELNITVPESMFRETRNDAIRNIGNRSVHHHPDGTMTPIR